MMRWASGVALCGDIVVFFFLVGRKHFGNGLSCARGDFVFWFGWSNNGYGDWGFARIPS